MECLDSQAWVLDNVASNQGNHSKQKWYGTWPWDLLLLSYNTLFRSSQPWRELEQPSQGTVEASGQRQFSARIGFHPSDVVCALIQKHLHGSLFPVGRIHGSGNQGLEAWLVYHPSKWCTGRFCASNNYRLCKVRGNGPQRANALFRGQKKGIHWTKILAATRALWTSKARRVTMAGHW